MAVRDGALGAGEKSVEETMKAGSGGESELRSAAVWEVPDPPTGPPILAAPAPPMETRPLPQEVVALTLEYGHATTELVDSCRRLRRGIEKAETQGAGLVSLAAPDNPAAQALHMGLPWPRTGSHRCRQCAECRQGGCKAQGIQEPCSGCCGNKTCLLLVCRVPYQAAVPPSVRSVASTVVVTVAVMERRIQEVKNVGIRYREVSRRLMDGLVIHDCETEEVP